MNSGFFKLNWNDIGKGVLVAVLAALLTALQQGLEAHGINFGNYDWGLILNVCLTAGASYLVKNLFTDSQGRVLGVFGSK